MTLQEPKPHFVVLPFLAQGHMLPMMDIARLLAKHGAIVSILTTPVNANRFKSLITRSIDSGLSIRVFHLKFPFQEVGLPEGCENFDMLPSLNDGLKLIKATALLENQAKKLMSELKPSCLIADTCFPWATNVALCLNIPRIVFHGMCCFSLLCMHMVGISNHFEDIASDFEYFVMPGLPDRIEVTKAQVNGMTFRMSSDWAKIHDEMREAEVNAFGTVVNSFQELEPAYVEEYRKAKGKKVWCVGPVSLCNKDDLDKAERGNKTSIDEHECLKWLDSQEPSSVLYVCLGSVSPQSTPQLIELGLALEASGRPFIWVVKNTSDGFRNWILEEKFEERNKTRGLLIYGWAPQVLVLSNPSVGGFLTHCGWNSSLEGISGGLPMMTWPLHADQFANEKFIVNVIKTGVRVGIEVPVHLGDEGKAGVLVKKDGIRKAIDDLMDGGDEGRERRARARKLGEMAKTAGEEGGSSYLNMEMLIQDVISNKQTMEIEKKMMSHY